MPSTRMTPHSSNRQTAHHSWRIRGGESRRDRTTVALHVPDLDLTASRPYIASLGSRYRCQFLNFVSAIQGRFAGPSVGTENLDVDLTRAGGHPWPASRLKRTISGACCSNPDPSVVPVSLRVSMVEEVQSSTAGTVECRLRAEGCRGGTPLYTEEFRKDAVALYRAENARLRGAEKEWQLEREILRRAAAYFTSMPSWMSLAGFARYFAAPSTGWWLVLMCGPTGPGGSFVWPDSASVCQAAVGGACCWSRAFSDRGVREAAFECAPGFGPCLAFVEFALVVDAAGPWVADLVDGDGVQHGIELAIATGIEPVACVLAA